MRQTLEEKFNTLEEIAKQLTIERLKENFDLEVTPHIKDIYVNEKKRVVTVKYTDDTISQATCNKDDKFDPYIGTCVAIARRFCGSKVNLDHMIKKRTHIQG